MKEMFRSWGTGKMTTLNLGGKFITTNVKEVDNYLKLKFGFFL